MCHMPRVQQLCHPNGHSGRWQLDLRQVPGGAQVLVVQIYGHVLRGEQVEALQALLRLSTSRLYSLQGKYHFDCFRLRWTSAALAVFSKMCL